MVTKLTLEYDGTAFAGWGRQPGLRTVQEELERALRTVLGETATDGPPLRLTVAGRTDRGRARLGPGRQLRPRGRRSAAPERAAGGRYGRAASRTGAGGLRRAARRAQPHLLLPRARAPRAQRVRARRRRSGGPASSIRMRWANAPRRSSGDTTSRPSRRRRPSTAVSRDAGAGAGRAPSGRRQGEPRCRTFWSALRPRRSCAT